MNEQLPKTVFEQEVCLSVCLSFSLTDYYRITLVIDLRLLAVLL